MIIDCISDLHGFYPELQGGDLLIIAGDLTARDEYQEMYDFEKEWLRFQKIKYKKTILIAGNHDNILQNDEWIWKGIDYLQDSNATFEGLKIYGSPWTLQFEGMNPACMAFTVDTDEELAKKWALIPDDVDILITHSPPYGIMDAVSIDSNREIFGEEHVGSKSLYKQLSSSRIRPKLHVFGHIHEGYGHIPKIMDIPGCQFVNASHVNRLYQPVNNPIRIELFHIEEN